MALADRACRQALQRLFGAQAGQHLGAMGVGQLHVQQDEVKRSLRSRCRPAAPMSALISCT
ncbi:MAG: hypothetical protein U1F53_10520 [Burkholderiaceae bacterium]